jgi:hypothetical protein
MADYRVNYTDLSWKLVGQLSWVLMDRVTRIDPNSSGTRIFYVREDDYAIVHESALFPKGTRHFLAVLVESIIKEVGAEKVVTVLKDWKLTDAFGKALGGSS